MKDKALVCARRLEGSTNKTYPSGCYNKIA